MDLEKPKFGTRKWFENYWYHYKWHTIIGLFIVFIIVSLVHDILTREKYDAELMITGQTYVTSTPAGRIALLLEQYCGDYDGNGEIKVNVVDNIFPSDMAQAEMMMAAQTKLMVELSDGRSMVMILDDYTYDMINQSSEGNFFADISAYSDKAYDGGTKVKLADTPIGDDPGLAGCADDYFLALRIPDMRAANRDEEAVLNYQNQVEMLKNLLSDNKVNPFEVPPPEEDPLLAMFALPEDE